MGVTGIITTKHLGWLQDDIHDAQWTEKGTVNDVDIDTGPNFGRNVRNSSGGRYNVANDGL